MSHSEAPEGKAKAEQLAPPHAAKTPKGQVKADTRLSPAALQTALPPVPPKAGPWHLVPLGPLAAPPLAPNKAGPPGPPAALPPAPPKASPPGPPTTSALVHPDAWPLEPPKAGPLGPPPLVVRRRKAPPPAWQLLPQAPYVGEATKGQGVPYKRPPPVYPAIDLGVAPKPLLVPSRKAPPAHLLTPASSSDQHLEADYSHPPKASEMVAMAKASVSQMADENPHGASASSASSALDPQDPNVEAANLPEDPRGVQEGEEAEDT